MKTERVEKRKEGISQILTVKENWDSVFSGWKNFVLLIFNLDKKADKKYGTKDLIHIIISTLGKKYCMFYMRRKKVKSSTLRDSWNLNNPISMATFTEYWSCLVLKAFVQVFFPNPKWTLWGIVWKLAKMTTLFSLCLENLVAGLVHDNMTKESLSNPDNSCSLL